MRPVPRPAECDDRPTAGLDRVSVHVHRAHAPRVGHREYRQGRHGPTPAPLRHVFAPRLPVTAARVYGRVPARIVDAAAMTGTAPADRHSTLRDIAGIAAGVAFGIALLALAFLLAARPIDPARPLDACETVQKDAPLTRACAKPVNRELPRAFPSGEPAR